MASAVRNAVAMLGLPLAAGAGMGSRHPAAFLRLDKSLRTRRTAADGPASAR